MSKAGDALADRILSELSELSALTDRVRRAWEMVVSRNDDFYLGTISGSRLESCIWSRPTNSL